MPHSLSPLSRLQNLRLFAGFRWPSQKLALRALLVGFCVALVACNAIKTTYNQGETLLRWWLDEYVDFQPDQETLVKAALSKQFSWHRASQLPAYMQVLSRAKAMSQRTVSKAEMTALYDDGRKYAYVVVDHFLPDVADLALQFTPEQLQHMEEKFADNNEKFRKQYMRGSLDAQQKARFDKVLERAESLYGGFTNAQEAAIRKASDARPLNHAFIMAERVRRQKELVAVLRRIQKEKPNRAQAVEWLRGYVANFEKSPNPERRAYAATAVDAGVDLAVTIANLANAEQRQYAQKRLQGWMEDVVELRQGK